MGELILTCAAPPLGPLLSALNPYRVSLTGDFPYLWLSPYCTVGAVVGKQMSHPAGLDDITMCMGRVWTVVLAGHGEDGAGRREQGRAGLPW